jgi:hypothetical protein
MQHAFHCGVRALYCACVCCTHRFYVVVGSALYVSVGRTISFDGHAAAVRFFLGGAYCERGCCGGANEQCNDEIGTRLPEAARTYSPCVVLHMIHLSMSPHLTALAMCGPP